MLCMICCVASFISGGMLSFFIITALALAKRTDHETEEFYAAVADREHAEFFAAHKHLEPRHEI